MIYPYIISPLASDTGENVCWLQQKSSNTISNFYKAIWQQVFNWYFCNKGFFLHHIHLKTHLFGLMQSKQLTGHLSLADSDIWAVPADLVLHLTWKTSMQNFLKNSLLVPFLCTEALSQSNSTAANTALHVKQMNVPQMHYWCCQCQTAPTDRSEDGPHVTAVTASQSDCNSNRDAEE